MISYESIHILTIMNLTMLIFLCASYIISLGVLLQTPDHAHSSKRFWIKLLTCIHPLLILWVGFLNQSYLYIDFTLLGALIFALLGDIALGLKHRYAVAMPLGIISFSLTHVTLFILLYDQAWFIWTILIVVGVWLILFRTLTKHLVFGSYTTLIMIYSFLILMMFGLATTSFIQMFDIHHFILWLGALSFLMSDILLAQKYFAKAKNPWINVAYLLLYHLALSLFTLSAFV